MEQNSNKKSRISTSASIVLVITAVIADILSLIPIVGDLTGPIYWVIVSYYLWKIGCGFVNAKQLATKAISMVAEMIPAVQEFPLTVAGIVVVIMLIKIEEKTGVNLTSLAGGAKKPLNHNGIRLPPAEESVATPKPAYNEGIRPPNGGLVR